MNTFFWNLCRTNLPAVLYYRIQHYHENKQKPDCLFNCREAFSKNCTFFSGISFTLLFSPFCKFLISLYTDLEDWWDSKSVSCLYSMKTIQLTKVSSKMQIAQRSCGHLLWHGLVECVLVHTQGLEQDDL